jgi:hypothetical protein
MNFVEVGLAICDEGVEVVAPTFRCRFTGPRVTALELQVGQEVVLGIRSKPFSYRLEGTDDE